MDVIVLIDDDIEAKIVMEIVIDKYFPGTELIYRADTSQLASNLGNLTGRPLVFVLDYYIKGPLDGPGVFQWLQTVPVFCGVPVVGISASVGNYEQEQLRKLGFMMLASKPFDLDVFGQALKSAIARKGTWQFLPSPKVKF